MGIAGAIIGAAIAVGSTFVSTAVISTAMLLIGSTLVNLSLASKTLAERQRGIKESVSDPQATLPVLYGGPNRVGMKLVDLRVDPNSTKRRDLYMVGAFCVGSQDGNGIERIGNIYFEDDLAVERGPDAGSTDGTVQDRFFGVPVGDTASLQSLIDFAVYRGTDSQSVDSQLNDKFGSEWPTTSDMTGIAYVRLKLTFSRDTWNGVPKVTADVWGNRVYDPRDPTGGPNNNGYKFHTDTSNPDYLLGDEPRPGSNPTLCTLDYLTSDRYGAGFDRTQLIDEDSFIAEANEDDNNVTHGQPQFHCNGFIDTGSSFDGNLRHLLASKRGSLIFQNGLYRIHTKNVQTPVDFEFNEQNIVGGYTLKRGGKQDVANRVQVSFVDPDNEYEAMDFFWPEPGEPNAFLDADNDEKETKDVELQLVQDDGIAKNIAKVMLQENRRDEGIEFRTTEEALQLQVGDVVTVSHEDIGLDSKEFWVDDIGILPNGEIRVALSEYEAAAYDTTTVDPIPSTPGTTLPDPRDVDSPENLAVDSGGTLTKTLKDGTTVPVVQITWDSPADSPFLDTAELEWRLNGESNWRGLAEVGSDTTEYRFTGPSEGDVIDIRARYISTTRNVSAWVELTGHTVQETNTNQLPGFDIETSESATSATVDVTVKDPGGGTLAVRFYERSGSGTYPATADQEDTGVASGSTVSYTASRSEKTNTFVKVEIEIEDNGNTATPEVVFGVDNIAVVHTATAAIDTDGTVIVDAAGDPDTAKMYVTVGVDTTPSDPTATNNSGEIDGRSGSVDTGVSIPTDSTAFVKVRGENVNTDLAPSATIKTTQVTNRGTGTDFPTPSDVTGFSGEFDEASLRMSWDEVPESGIAHYELREGGTDWASASPFATIKGDHLERDPEDLTQRSYTFRIKAVNVEDDKSTNAAGPVTVENPAPDASSLSPTTEVRPFGIFVSFTEAGSEGNRYELHGSLTSGFTPSSSTLHDTSRDSPLQLSLSNRDWLGETVFMKIVVHDALSESLGDEATSSEFSDDMSLVDTPDVRPLIRSALGQMLKNGFEPEEFDDWTDKSGATVSEETGDSWVGDQSGRFSSTTSTSGSSSGTTDGASIELPEEISQNFAGKEIFINLYAKQPSSGASSSFAVAYSTNDVGNSGWETFSPDTSWQRFSFRYSVPEPGSGGADYLGILGDASGGGNDVLIDQITIMQSAGGEVASLDLITANQIEAGTITATEIQSGTITATEIQTESITADRMDVNELSAIKANLGTITAGILENQSGSVFIDLDAGGNDPFIEHPNFTLEADGTASFAGSLSAASGTFEGTLSAALQQAQSLEIVADVEGDVGKNVEVQLGADTLTFFDTTNSEIELRIWPDSAAISGAQSISFRNDLVFSPFQAGDHLRYESGTHGVLPVAKTIVSTNTQSGSLEEGTIYVQVN